MKFNLQDVYRIKSGASHKKIYRFKKKNEGKIIVDFSYESDNKSHALSISKSICGMFSIESV